MRKELGCTLCQTDHVVNHRQKLEETKLVVDMLLKFLE